MQAKHSVWRKICMFHDLPHQTTMPMLKQHHQLVVQLIVGQILTSIVIVVYLLTVK